MDTPFPSGMIEDITKFFESEHTRLPGLDLYNEVFETALFFPLQRREELRKMMRIAHSIRPRTVMEIGSDKGGGLYHWVKCLPTVKNVIACEIRGLPYAKVFEHAFKSIDFLWLEDSSFLSSTVQDVKRWLGYKEKIDCLFIDGDKTKFLEDFDAYLPLMDMEGIVFLHDIQDREPKKAFEEIQSRGYRTSRILNITESVEAMKRKDQGIPCTNAHEGWLRYWEGTSAGVGVVYLDSKERD